MAHATEPLSRPESIPPPPASPLFIPLPQATRTRPRTDPRASLASKCMEALPKNLRSNPPRAPGARHDAGCHRDVAAASRPGAHERADGVERRRADPAHAIEIVDAAERPV